MNAKEEIKHLSALAKRIRENSRSSGEAEARYLQDYAEGIERAAKEIALLNGINEATQKALALHALCNPYPHGRYTQRSFTTRLKTTNNQRKE